MIPRKAALLALTVLQIVLALHVVGAVDCQFSSYAEDGSYVSYVRHSPCAATLTTY